MVNIEPRSHCFRPVVCAANEFATAASIANSINLRPVVALVIAGTTLLTGKASGETIDQGGFVNFELDHMVKPVIASRQHLIERLRLCQRSGETVEHKAVTTIRLLDTVGDHVDNYVVGDELA